MKLNMTVTCAKFEAEGKNYEMNLDLNDITNIDIDINNLDRLIELIGMDRILDAIGEFECCNHFNLIKDRN